MRLRFTSGARYPIVGMGSFNIYLRSRGGGGTVQLLEVGHVPGLSYHLVSLRPNANAGNYVTGTSKSMTIKLSSMVTNSFPHTLSS